MFHVSTWEHKKIFCVENWCAVGEGNGTCDFHERYMFHVSTWNVK